MATLEYGSSANLEDLRRQLTEQLALLWAAASGLVIWQALPQKSFPIFAFGLWTGLMGLGLGVRALVSTQPVLARHLLVWGLTAGLLASMTLFSGPWLPFLGLLLIFLGTLLITGGGLATMGVIVAVSIWLTHSGVRTYPLPGLFLASGLGATLAWLIARTLYTALQWAWTTQQRADNLLEVARGRQGELSRTLKSLELVNDLLRRTQRELVFARKQADEALHMKEQFAANISHELRTPLNLILGFSEVMYMSPQVYGEMPWPPTLRRDVYHIYRSSRHLLEMIDDILDLSRFEMAGFTLNKEPTPLASLLQGTVEIAEALFRGHPVHLEVEIAPDLPILEIDRTRIRQVLLNLLTNARRFTESGMVRLGAKQIEGEVVVSVSDTGGGIPADQLLRVFDEFYQVHYSLHRKHQGAGLGLAISKRFVQAHEGRIWVESQEGKGSTFYFTIPIPGYYPPIVRSHVEHPVEPSWPEACPRILVLDPDPAVADLVRRHLEGYEVVQVTEANRLAEEVMLHHPRAVVCNVPPGERGDYDSIASLPVPFFECSLPSQAWLADDLAVAACLTKPVTARQLLSEIERLGSIRDVLIIDDDRGFCQLVERMLDATGRSLEVRRAYDGEEGLLALRSRRPDLVLLDLIMPGVDGFQVLEEIRQTPELASVPVILLTATSYGEDVLTQHGNRVVIHRPDGLRPAEVLDCLRMATSILEPHYDERLTPEV